MIFTKTLPDADSIQVRTYRKNEHMHMNGFSLACQDVIVHSINIGAGTVNATLGNVPAKDYPKEQLFHYLNRGFHE